jgi:predicted flap endonuclease-1-like 5' DNA nuclease
MNPADVQRLEAMIMSFAHEVRDRIFKLEDNISVLKQTVDALQLAQVTSARLPSSTSALVLPTPSPVSSGLQLKVISLVHKWYTKRQMPDFEVHVVDANQNVFPHTPGWQLHGHLYSNNGSCIDHFVNAPVIAFPFHDGKAVVSGLRFSAVSSRNGGSFYFDFSVKASADAQLSQGVKTKSPEFRVLSERLKNEAKAESIFDLQADAPLARVPGIGKKYAARMTEFGLHTIQDLAAMNLMDPAIRKQLLDIVRRERGALTEIKLDALCRDAQLVVANSDELDETQQQQPAQVQQSPIAMTHTGVKRASDAEPEFEFVAKEKRVKVLEDEQPMITPGYEGEFDYAAEVDAMINHSIINFEDADDDLLFF